MSEVELGNWLRMFNVQKNFGHREYLSVFWALADHKKSKFRLPSLYPCANCLSGMRVKCQPRIPNPSLVLAQNLATHHQSHAHFPITTPSSHLIHSFTMSLRTRPFLRLRQLQSPPLSRSRKYHSYDHPPPPGPFTPTESLILSSAVPHIPSHGFTLTSLSLGTKDAGYMDASTNLFPQGAFSLVHYHLYTQRLALAEHKSIIDGTGKEGEKPLGVGAKVKKLTWERLMGNKEIIHRWQEVCLRLLSRP